jgi:hypothetical protein
VNNTSYVAAHYRGFFMLEVYIILKIYFIEKDKAIPVTGRRGL